MTVPLITMCYYITCMTIALITMYDNKTEHRELKRKYNWRDCQCALFLSSTELSSPTILLS